MGNVNYMQNNNGRITVFCEQLPDKGFIDAEKVRTVCSIRIKTRKEKLQGNRTANDVDVLYATGERGVISRTQLVKEFRHSNGKKIKIYTLRSGQKYLVTRNSPSRENYKVMKLPDNCVGTLKGAPVNSGMYIICKANEDGTPNKETMYTMSPTMFRKMFKIPMQAVIKRNMNKPKTKEFGLFNPRKVAELRNRAKRSRLSDLDLFDMADDFRSRSMPQNPNINLGTGVHTTMYNVSKPTMDPPANNSENTQTQDIARPINQNVMQQHVANNSASSAGSETPKKSQYKYTITHRLVSMTNNSLVGFMVKEISSGRTRQCAITQVHKLCEQKLVDNVMLVQRDNGIRFLKGNNMRIENLPQMLV